MFLLRSQKKLPSVGESILRSFFERSKIEVFLFTFIREEKRPSPKKDICCKKKLLTFVCVFGLCCCRFVPNMGIKAWVKYLIKSHSLSFWPFLTFIIATYFVYSAQNIEIVNGEKIEFWRICISVDFYHPWRLCGYIHTTNHILVWENNIFFVRKFSFTKK